MALTRSSFIRLWLLSAGIVVLIRLVHGTDLAYDPTIQLQAARNLLNGRGLTVYSITGELDLATPNRLVVLTYFPAGYSLGAAGLIALGCSAFTALKILGASATLLGWWGWARLAYSFMRDGMERLSLWRNLAIAIALVTPCLTTPPWAGTDIFLWAAVPWILQLVTSSRRSDSEHPIHFDLIAGALTGLSVLMRYQALFLIAYVALLIGCQSPGKPAVFFRRLSLFAVGLAPFLATQIFVNHLHSGGPFEAGGINLNHSGNGLTLAQYVRLSTFGLTAANFSLIWWLRGWTIDYLTQFGTGAPWLLAVTLVALVVIPIVFAIGIGQRSIPAAARDVRSASIGLILALPLSLWACGFGGVIYAPVTRYYLPLIPLGVLAAYAYAVHGDTTQKQVFELGARVVAIGYLAGFLCLSCLRILFLPVPGDLGDSPRGQLLGVRIVGHWISLKPEYTLSPARQYVVSLLRERPESILVTNRENWFYAESDVDHSRLHRFEGLKSVSVTGPARLVILAEDPTPSADNALCWYRSWGGVVPVHQFESVPDLHLVRRFPDENMKVLEAEIPAGTRIALNPSPHT